MLCEMSERSPNPGVYHMTREEEEQFQRRYIRPSTPEADPLDDLDAAADWRELQDQRRAALNGTL